MCFHILKLSKRYGFIKTLIYLTAVSKKDLLKLQNEFKPDFWENQN